MGNSHRIRVYNFKQSSHCLLWCRYSFFFFKCFYSFLRDWERQSASGGRAEKEGDTESEAGSRLKPRNWEIVTWAEVGSAVWAIQVPLYVDILILNLWRSRPRFKRSLSWPKLNSFFCLFFVSRAKTFPTIPYLMRLRFYFIILDSMLFRNVCIKTNIC